MKTNNIKNLRYKLCIFCCCLSSLSYGQNFWHKSVIVDSIPQSGYYNIELSPEVISLTGGDYSRMIRLFDNDNNETAFVKKEDYQIQNLQDFVPYKIHSHLVKDSINTIIVDNKKQENLNIIYIVTRNADTRKKVEIRGSDNLEQWYIVKKMSDVSFADYQVESNNEVLAVQFPQGNYKYYEIVLMADTKSPVEVEKVGYFVNINSKPVRQYTEIDLGKMTLKSKDKQTIISFPELKYNYPISKLDFNIENKLDYLRTGKICELNNYLFDFELSSKTNNQFILDDVPISNKTEFVINNGDNKQLNIKFLKAYCTKIFLVAYLEEGKTYDIHIGNPNYNSIPEYDLTHYKNKLQDALATLNTGTITQVEVPTLIGIINERDVYWFEQPWFMWSAIIIVGLILVYMCYKMAKNTSQKD